MISSFLFGLLVASVQSFSPSTLGADRLGSSLVIAEQADSEASQNHAVLTSEGAENPRPAIRDADEDDTEDDASQFDSVVDFRSDLSELEVSQLSFPTPRLHARPQAARGPPALSF
jgi:hypothetical protein